MTRAPLEGVLPVDKPEGPTSHDVVGRARRALGERRIGHTGTLDPFASGLLLLCVGGATRLSEYLTGMDKHYEATAVLGTATDSGDRDGEVVSSAPPESVAALSLEAVEAAVAALRGVQRQVPPALSARKVGGVPAHRRVRRGEEVTLEAREVTIHAFEVDAWEPPLLRLRVHCSSGTYVRSLARDLGEALGVGGHLGALRRTAVGRFGVEGALTPDDLADAERVGRALIAPLEAVAHLPRVDVDEKGVLELGHGRSVPAPGLSEGTEAACAHQQRLVAVGFVRDGVLRPRKVFAA